MRRVRGGQAPTAGSAKRRGGSVLVLVLVPAPASAPVCRVVCCPGGSLLEGARELSRELPDAVKVLHEDGRDLLGVVAPAFLRAVPVIELEAELQPLLLRHGLAHRHVKPRRSRQRQRQRAQKQGVRTYY